MLKRRLPRCQILGFYKSLADHGLADPQLVQQRKEPRDGYHARCPAQTQAFSEAVGTESDRSGSVDPMYRGVFAAPSGRMGAARAAGAVRSEPRHRAQIARFLGRKMLRRLSPASVLRSQVLAMESQKSGT